MEQNTRPPQKRRKVTRRQLRQRRIIGLAALLLIIFLLSSGCASCIRCACKPEESQPKQEAAVTTTAVSGTTAPTQATTETATTLPQEYLAASLPDSYQIPVDVLYQEPELPTGNEITSLTMLLNFLGFDVTKQNMANNFLTCAEVGNATFSQAFICSPFDSSGYGCLAPVIVDAAQKYLKSQNSGRTVKTLNVNSFDDILLRIASNHPVLVWVNQDLELMQEEYCFTIYDNTAVQTTTAPAAGTAEIASGTEAAPSEAATEAPTETEVYWIPNATCVVLTGYDLENNTVTVIDPTQGEVTYDMEMFKTSYNALYKQAIIIY